MPLPCEMAPSVTSMTGITVTRSIRPACVGHANQAGSHPELRLQGGHSAVWRTQCKPQAALQPAHPPPHEARISGPATCHHSVHTLRVIPAWSCIAPPMSGAVQSTQSEGGAYVPTPLQPAVSSHSSASTYVDPTPRLATRPGRGRGKAVVNTYVVLLEEII